MDSTKHFAAAAVALTIAFALGGLAGFYTGDQHRKHELDLAYAKGLQTGVDNMARAFTGAP